MGSYITLGIKKMEIDWGKNYNYTNHSRLFQERDFDKDIPYYYVDNDDNEIIEYKKDNILIGQNKNGYLMASVSVFWYRTKKIVNLLNSDNQLIRYRSVLYHGRKIDAVNSFKTTSLISPIIDPSTSTSPTGTFSFIP